MTLDTHGPDHYSALYELAPVGYVTFDAVGRMREINAAAAALIGRPREALLGRSFASLLSPGQGDAFYRHLEQVFAGPDVEPAGVELALEGAAGLRELWLQSRAHHDGEVDNALSVLVDVTDRRAAQRLDRDEEWLRQAMLDALPAHIVVLDRNGRIVAVNEAWRRFARSNDAPEGLARAVGMDYLASCDAVPAGHSDSETALEARRGIEAVMRGEKAEFRLEYPCHGPDRQRWFAMIATPLGGGVGGVVIAHVDVTDQVVAEETNRKRREALAHASRLSSVGVLAGSLIHELSQPLTAAKLYTDYLVAVRESPAPDWSRFWQVAAELDGQIERVVDVVDGLRRFLQRQESTVQLCEVDDLIDQATGLVRMAAREKHVELEVRPTGADVCVEGNPVQLVQVLVNLLCNALEAVHREGPEERRVCLSAQSDGGRVRLTVWNSGPALSPERARGMFSVLDGDRDTNLGMGLAISRSIAEAHGGSLRSDPAVRAGALFRVELPQSGTERSQ